MYQNSDFMAEKQKFKLYYEEKILPVLKETDKIRKKSLLKFCIVLLFVIAWIIWEIYNNTNYEIINILIVLCILWPMFGYYRKSKENILPLLASFFGDFVYAYEGNLSETLLKQAKIMPMYDKLKTDDSFKGEYDSVPVEITEYILYNREVSRKTGFRYTQIARGVIFYALMNKKFSGQTIVVKDKGWLNKFTCPRHMQRVGLESPEFEKAFEVYSDNQIEARFILTPVMMEYMMKLRQDFPYIQFSFFNQHVVINIKSGNFFECSSFFTSVINKKRIEQNFEELYLLLSIIRTLKLNQKQML